MAFDQSGREDSGALRLGRGERLGTVERIVVLAIIGIIVSLDIIGLFLPPGVEFGAALISVASTAVFALYLWSPLWATVSLAVIFGLSFLTGTETQVLTAAAFAAGMVMRLGRGSLIFSYIGVFLLSAALIAFGDTRVPVNVGVQMILAAVAGAIGYALRLAAERGRRLERELAVQVEKEHEAVLAERRWIAGELHDSIAHHLTVVALHVQMLDDPSMTAESQEAIRVAARKAMADLRFVIELADDGPRSEGMQTGDLDAAIDEARAEIEAAGHPVRISGDPRDEHIPRVAEIAFARIVRESATNILKHAGAGEVSILLDVDDESAALAIRSPMPSTPRRDLPSSGTGLNRMAERVLGASGEFDAGEHDGSWQVRARLPLA
ncbi:sensor histidine kinase [Streptomyces sp. AC495_CC817]|uniref:sensor histidine kinase n=1 Tax=Streptomyces sp. AC495_CC817 TaxID=2823900 RepID=UPI001C2670A6|nr:histidine kinase [Streptomyces sp. AC495_CC817]